MVAVFAPEPLARHAAIDDDLHVGRCRAFGSFARQHIARTHFIEITHHTLIREEMRHFFKDFADEVSRFVARYSPRQLVLLGTDENVAKFREFLPQQVQALVVFTGPAPVDGPAPEILARLEPHLRAEQERHGQELIEQVRDRAAHDYLATAGVQGTLSALQEGKVDTLVLARDGQLQGARCTQCSFVFVRDVTRCPYDGSEELEGVDVMEEMVRLAQQQGADIQFADANAIADLRGAAALLRF